MFSFRNVRQTRELAYADCRTDGKMASQGTKTAKTEPLSPAEPLSDEYWDAVLQDPKARSGEIPIQNRRLSEIPRHILRVSCRRCDRIVEIQTIDAVRLYGSHAIWKDFGGPLLDNGCQTRTGSREDDGCWPSFDHHRLT
jgi:hypothetical protein